MVRPDRYDPDRDIPDEDPVVDLTGVRSQNPWKRAKKKISFPEIYNYFDPDQLRHPEQPPDHVRVAFEELIASDHPGDFKLRLHPWFRRWALFQRFNVGEGDVWHCFSVFMEKPVEGKLPSDLAAIDDGRYEGLRSLMGEYRLPNRRDFEIIRRDADITKMGHAAVDARQQEIQDMEHAEADRVAADYEADFLDYNFDLIKAAANGGHRQYVKGESKEEVEASRRKREYVVEERKGFKILHRKGSEGARAYESREHAEREERMRKAHLMHQADKAGKQAGLRLIREAARKAEGRGASKIVNPTKTL